MKVHQLKCFNVFYQMVVSGAKPWEIRQNDRDYQVGDVIVLNEISPENNYKPTGNKSTYLIKYILTSEEFGGLTSGYVCLTIEPLKQGETAS